jgi:hypothetical protein
MRRHNPPGESRAYSKTNSGFALCRNVRQPNQVLGDEIAGQQVERWPGTGEVWLAAAKHDGMEVDPILIDKPSLGQASR